MSASVPSRYHPLLVGLHWLIALLVFMALAAGIFLKGLPNEATKIGPLSIHMLLGISILVLMLTRFIVRLLTKKPAPATAGNAFLDKVGVAVHWLLYVAVFGMALSGLGTSAQAGLADIVFRRSGAPLPVDFFAFPARYGHGYTSIVLMVLIAVHVGAWLYHQFIRKDNLFARMWFGNR
jgi:cytochrome b561